MFLLWCSLYAMWYQLNMVNFFFKVDGWSFIYTPMHECKLKTDDTVSYVSITATAFPDLQPFRQNYRCFTCSIKINVKRQNPAKTSRTSLLWHLAPQSSSGKNEFEGTFLKGGRGNTAHHIPWLLYSFPRPASSFTLFTASASPAPQLSLLLTTLFTVSGFSRSQSSWQTPHAVLPNTGLVKGASSHFHTPVWASGPPVGCSSVLRVSEDSGCSASQTASSSLLKTSCCLAPLCLLPLSTLNPFALNRTKCSSPVPPLRVPHSNHAIVALNRWPSSLLYCPSRVHLLKPPQSLLVSVCHQASLSGTVSGIFIFILLPPVSISFPNK